MSDQGDRGGRRIAALAVIAATGVAVIYIPQPIQTLVANEFGVWGPSTVAATIAVQAGYALGIVLLVSLGDRYSARRQVTAQLVATGGVLALSAIVPHYWLFVALTFVAGATATIGQLLVSSALRLAAPAARARTAAVLLGSFIVGLFVVRTALGTVAELLGWRGAVMTCAVLVFALVPLSLRVSPSEAPSDPPPYGRILTSIPRIAASSPTLRLLATVHVLCFMTFIALWSIATVYAVDELGLTVAQASLLGLAGLAGGGVTIAVAPVHARVGATRSLAVCIAAVFIGAALIAIAPPVLPLTIVALVLVSGGMSSEQVTSQAIALASVSPSESGRANTIFMAATFFGGAIVTAVASQLFALGGYAAVGALGSALAVAAAFLALAAQRRGMLSATR